MSDTKLQIVVLGVLMLVLALVILWLSKKRGQTITQKVSGNVTVAGRKVTGLTVQGDLHITHSPGLGGVRIEYRGRDAYVTVYRDGSLGGYCVTGNVYES